MITLTRTRVKTGNKQSLYSKYLDTPPGTWSGTSTFGSVTLDERYIQDTIHPNYRAAINRGEVIMSPCTIEKTVNTCPISSVVAVGPISWGTRQWEGTLSSIHLLDVNEPTSYEPDLEQIRVQLVNQAFSEAYASTASLAVTIAEGNKTLQMFRKPMGKARNLVSEMLYKKASLIRKGLTAAKAISSVWLEYRMGWKPVLYDIDNIMKASAEQLVDYKSTVRETSRKTQVRNWTGINQLTLGAGSGYNSGLVTARKTVSNKITAGVLFEKKLYSPERASSVRAVRDRFGLNFRDVLLTGWELVPLSFVVDRFVDVSTFLGSIQPNPNVTVLGSWRSEKRTAHLESTLEWYKINTTPPCYTGKSLPHVSDRETLTRVVGVTPSWVPQLTFRELSLNQHADHAALILSGLLRFKER